MSELFNIEEELDKLPKKPGVYIMRNETGGILYVGKATNLHNRVRQYFRSGHGHNNSPKIIKMVSQISYFEYIITKSEIEALVLECNLIKEHRPKYNTLMTDDKGYPYIRVTTYEDYPRIMMSHQMKRDKSLYFGPFTDRKAVKDIILLIRKLFLLRSCSIALPEKIGKDRPCLYAQIGQCCAPCSGNVSKDEYMSRVNDAISFLNGNHSDIAKKLKESMNRASEELEFEEAAKYRDLLTSIEHIMEKQRVSKTSEEDRDVIAIARNDEDIVVSIFFIREGNLIGRENHHMKADSSDSDGEIINEFIKQYYTGTPYIPKEIITKAPVADSELLRDYLAEKSGVSIHFLVPQKGEKAHLLKLAEDNARLVLAQDIERIKRLEKRTKGACDEIAEILGIEKADRMEAFDISNISGYHSVASMVVFEEGKPKKNSYRKFRLRTVEGPDDYASMKEVLTRRYTDEKLGPLPDVLMMDGGKGQVNIATMVLDSLGIDIPVCGMVKDDNHRTRGLYYNNKEVTFKPGSEAIHMITSLQDETHRFAITYHRELRSKEQVRSILDDIPGVGPKRRAALLLHFRDIESIKSADINALLEVEGITEPIANSIYDFFH